MVEGVLELKGCEDVEVDEIEGELGEDDENGVVEMFEGVGEWGVGGREELCEYGECGSYNGECGGNVFVVLMLEV